MSVQKLVEELEQKIREELKPAEYVVVRSSKSGVWCGRLVSRDGEEVVLLDARRAYSWSGAFTCCGLAVYGPTGGKITATVSRVVIRDCCEVIDATQEAVARWASSPEHKP